MVGFVAKQEMGGVASMEERAWVRTEGIGSREERAGRKREARGRE